MSVGDLFARVRAALADANVPYMLTGSFASSVHGAPRATQDVDIVIAPIRTSLLALLAAFPEDQYYVNAEAAQFALSSEGQFNIIDLATGWKIDFIIRKSTPFGTGAFARRQWIDIAGLSMAVASAEDVVISKLDWARQASSDRQLEDVAGVVRTQGARLDVAYIEQWVARLSLEDEWVRAKAKAI